MTSSIMIWIGTRGAEDLEIAIDVMAGPDDIDGRGWTLSLPRTFRRRLSGTVAADGLNGATVLDGTLDITPPNLRLKMCRKIASEPASGGQPAPFTAGRGARAGAGLGAHEPLSRRGRSGASRREARVGRRTRPGR